MSKRDQIFNQAYQKVSAFAFDEQVVSVFPDMIKRSVPGYDTILKGIAMFAMRFVADGSRVYDLGTSLGAVSLTIDQAIGQRGVDIYAVDNSVAMTNELNKLLSSHKTHNNILVKTEDLRAITVRQASMVVSNFTLQFLPPDSRQAVCVGIYQGLQPNGVFVLSEKIASSQNMIDYYHGFKKINGYSDLEIAQKRQALEDSLKPDDLKQWLSRLEQAGFHTIEVWFQAFNFVSIVALK
ncbi:MAG: carboxy-S-adenosyl-L-methionine synthase CmoA [Proteobacteria bacterium]|nr:MAG: carboxy-S-adenosyl-L-methionine synthase CmoA [Pseudomonadota bacterium]